jgi:hypothetical protein
LRSRLDWVSWMRRCCVHGDAGVSCVSQVQRGGCGLKNREFQLADPCGRVFPAGHRIFVQQVALSSSLPENLYIWLRSYCNLTNPARTLWVHLMINDLVAVLCMLCCCLFDPRKHDLSKGFSKDYFASHIVEVVEGYCAVG